MNKTMLICGLTFTTTFMQPSQIFAAGSSKNDIIESRTQIELQHERTQSLVHKMIGHINLAEFALKVKRPQQATHQIENAQIIKNQLEIHFPELKISSKFNYGKITYANSHGIMYQYVPVVDDVLLVSDFENIFNRANELHLKETDSRVVKLDISVDLSEIKAALDTALKDINKKEYRLAQDKLTTAFKATISNEKEINEPILAISKNLALAKGFLNNGLYDNARFTFKHIQNRLDSASHDSLSEVDKDSINNLSANLELLKSELRKKDPTMTPNIDDRLDQLKKVFKEWFG